MNKSQWFISRKKIPIDKTVFRLLVVGAALYVFMLSILFLIQYFDAANWKDLVTRNQSKFGNVDSYEDAYNAMKLVYLMRFWGNVLIGILLEIMAYIYYKKTTTGYGFFSIWIIMIVGILITNFTMIKDYWYINLLSVLPLVIIVIGLFIGSKELYRHRKALNRQYLIKVRKGEL